MQAAFIELVDQRALIHGVEAELGEEVRGEGEDDDLAGMQAADAVERGGHEGAAEALLLPIAAYAEGLDFHGGVLLVLEFGQDFPGDRADDFAIRFGHEEAVDVEDDVAQCARDQFVGVLLDARKNAAGIGEGGGTDDERGGMTHGISFMWRV